MIERISPPGVAAPRGPYSPAVRAGDFIFVSGQVAVDPATQQLITGDIAGDPPGAQQYQGAAGRLRRQPRGRRECGVFLGKTEDFAAMNAVYSEFFGAGNRRARP